MYFCDAQLYFQHHYSSLQCHMIFRNHFNMLICCSRNISYYYQCWKLPNIFEETIIYVIFQDFWWIESSKEQNLHHYKCLDQFYAYLLNKSINFLKKKVSTKICSSITVFSIDNNQKCFLSSKSAYQNDFLRSCDTEDWSND